MSDIEKVKKIREATSLSVGEISKALAEAAGDESRALQILKERGVQIAGKKSSREIKEGIVECYIHGNRKIGAMVELGSETDFVAKNEEFKKLAHELAMQVASMDPKDSEELLSQSFIKDPSMTIADLVNQSIARLGENIKIGKIARFEI
ncbi:MAG: elongation factor Ts [Candidatus Yanofskybacteria bacterium]|nr:elongation factor Ts [Candidatus Yanofskybacteria bacterium]